MASLNVADGRITAVGLGRVGAVVAADVGGRALHGEQLAGDLLLVGGQRLGEPAERGGELGVVGLRGELLRPVEGEVEVAAAVVDLADAAGGRLVLVEERAGRPVERVGEHLGPGVAGGRGEVLEADGQGEELAEAVPAQVVLLDELLHVLGRRTAGAGLEQPAAVDQRDDRQHLGAGAELHDREQVGEVVAQHVAGDRDRVLAAADALEREGRGLDRGHDVDLEAARCRGRRGRPRPWRSGWRRGPGSASSQNTAGAPVARARVTASFTQSRIGDVLGLARPPDVAGRRRRAR